MNKLDIFSFKPHAFVLANGNTVYLRRLSAADKVNWIEYLNNQVAKGEGDEKDTLSLALDDSACLLSKVICDQQGNRRFTDEEAELVKTIDHELLDAMASEALKVNGFTKEASEDLKKS